MALSPSWPQSHSHPRKPRSKQCPSRNRWGVSAMSMVTYPASVSNSARMVSSLGSGVQPPKGEGQPSGHHIGLRWNRGEGGVVGPVEDQAAFAEGIQVGRLDPLISVTAQMVVARGIGHHDNDVNNSPCLATRKDGRVQPMENEAWASPFLRNRVLRGSGRLRA